MVPRQTQPRTENYSGWDGTWPKPKKKGGAHSTAVVPVEGDPSTLLAYCLDGKKVALILVVERHEVPLFVDHMQALNVSVHLLSTAA